MVVSVLGREIHIDNVIAGVYELAYAEKLDDTLILAYLSAKYHQSIEEILPTLTDSEISEFIEKQIKTDTICMTSEEYWNEAVEQY